MFGVFLFANSLGFLEGHHIFGDFFVCKFHRFFGGASHF